MKKLIASLLFPAICGFSLGGMAQGDDDGELMDKVQVCHKDKRTVTVAVPALEAHLGHGDYIGLCDDDDDFPFDDTDVPVATVMMHCEALDGVIQVTAFSSSAVFAAPPLIDLGVGSDCADALANLLNSGFHLHTVSGNTDYLLFGKVGESD